jgi:hypothetical protein
LDRMGKFDLGKFSSEVGKIWNQHGTMIITKWKIRIRLMRKYDSGLRVSRLGCSNTFAFSNHLLSAFTPRKKRGWIFTGTRRMETVATKRTTPFMTTRFARKYCARTCLRTKTKSNDGFHLGGN